MNDIIKIIDIEDEDISVVDQWIDGDTKYLVIEKRYTPMFCPICNSRMLSKGFYTRKVNHSMLLDGFKLIIILRQRKWRCSSSVCNHYCNDEFTFARKSKRQSDLLPFMILNALKDINRTCADVARMFNVSDTYVHEIFMSHIEIKRAPLPEALCIDAVFLDISYSEKYACVLMDFETSEIVDILPNRWKSTLDNYFYSIPLEERKKVKYIICDMYDTYVNAPDSYFPNAHAIIDSFHVISDITKRINVYLNSVKRKYIEKEKRELEQKNLKNNTNFKSMKKSKELRILNHFQYFLLGNQDALDYSRIQSYDNILHYYADDYEREKQFMALDPNFRILQDLKQKYIRFNSTIFENISDAEKELDKLIKEYEASGNHIFIEFARLLKRYRIPIIASFKNYELENGEIVRLSNGRMEGFNRFPKDMKRDARGFEVFEYIRARLIYWNRKNVPIKGIPKNKNDIARSKRKYRQNKKKKK